MTKEDISDKENEEKDDEDDNDDEDVFVANENYWKDSIKDLTEVEEKSIRKGGVSNKTVIDQQMLKDIFFYLNRLSDKADRLIGNFTSNLAESWMHIRCKFDGGKVNNKCFRASFYARCYGGALRSAKGPGWSPVVYQQVTEQRPDSVFISTYHKRSMQYLQTVKSSKKQSNKDKKRKRKMEINKQSLSKKAKLKYGKDILDDTSDKTPEEIQQHMDQFFKSNIEVTSEEIDNIEKETREQSLNEKWYEERKKRLTSSIFGDVISRGINNNTPKLTERLLYTKFTGNRFTRKGLSEESVTIEEYRNTKKTESNEITVTKPGFRISKDHPFLGASADGIVKINDTEGLVEVKNLLQNEKMLIKDAAATKKNFCLHFENEKVKLKKNHKYYYQIQGQLNIYGKQWCDFVVRRTNPYDLYVERILKDENLWNSKMVPKLKAFYFTHILPELAVPRYKTVTGIRKCNIPWVIYCVYEYMKYMKLKNKQHP